MTLVLGSAFEKLRKNLALSTCAFESNTTLKKNKNKYVVRCFKILSGPAVPVEAAILYGLGNVIGFYIFRAVEIGNGSCNF